MITLNKDTFESFLSEHEFCIVQFGSSTCMPCHAIKQRLEDWNRIDCAYVSVESDVEFCAQHGVFTVPTLHFYWNGKLQNQVSGNFSLDLFLNGIERIV